MKVIRVDTDGLSSNISRLNSLQNSNSNQPDSLFSESRGAACESIYNVYNTVVSAHEAIAMLNSKIAKFLTSVNRTMQEEDRQIVNRLQCRE